MVIYDGMWRVEGLESRKSRKLLKFWKLRRYIVNERDLQYQREKYASRICLAVKKLIKMLTDSKKS